MPGNVVPCAIVNVCRQPNKSIAAAGDHDSVCIGERRHFISKERKAAAAAAGDASSRHRKGVNVIETYPLRNSGRRPI